MVSLTRSSYFEFLAELHEKPIWSIQVNSQTWFRAFLSKLGFHLPIYKRNEKGKWESSKNPLETFLKLRSWHSFWGQKLPAFGKKWPDSAEIGHNQDSLFKRWISDPRNWNLKNLIWTYFLIIFPYNLAKFLVQSQRTLNFWSGLPFLKKFCPNICHILKNFRCVGH